MYKICYTVRNRLSISCKSIAALKKHSKLEHQIYVYEDCTNSRIQEHFMYWSMLYTNRMISQISFMTEDAKYNCFGKAVSSNMFLMQHEMDPKKLQTEFLVFLDNDMIVTPGWDEVLRDALKDVDKHGYDHIKVIGQTPGGIKDAINIVGKTFGGYEAISGRNGGSALWAVRNDFATKVGLLDVRNVYGINKKHDMEYWGILNKASSGKHYILGLKAKLGIHCGKFCGSVCNVLHRNHQLTKSKKEDLIKFENEEDRIDKYTFDEFYSLISENKDLERDY